MGMGIFGALHVAKSGLFVQQASVSVTANNLANVNTEGYSRQTAVIESIDSQMMGGVYFGRGAQLASITKSYDKFLNNSILLEKNILGQWNIKDTYLQQAETIFNESEDTGLNALLTDFWNAWEDLADNPEGIAERAVLQSAGESIAATFQQKASDLEAIQTDANNNLVTVVATINQLSQEIASLNSQILGSESQQSTANDLTDKRSLKLEELSELIDIRVLEQSNGQITAITSFGKPLVDGNISWTLSVSADEDRNNLYAINYSDGSTVTDITDKISGGSLNGLLEIRDQLVPAYLDKLNTLASTLVTEVNKIHYSGYGLDGSTGNYFFQAVPITLLTDDTNKGSGTVYAAQITDATELISSTFTLNFSSSSPQQATYELYDELNEQYLYRIDAGNSTIVFDDGGGDTIAALSQGTYTGNELAAEIEKQLDSKASTGQDYAVSYNTQNRKFTIINKGTAAVDFKWGSSDSTAAGVLGFIDTYTVTSGVNDTISYDDGTGGAAETATLKSGKYSGEEMAAEIKRALEASGDAQFAVSYDAASRGFTISVNTAAAPQNNVDFFWLASSAAASLGYNADAIDITVDGSSTSAVQPSLSTAAGNSSVSYFQGGTYEYAAQHFQVVNAANDTIIFRDDGTLTYRTAKLDAGSYTAGELAAEIKRQLEASSGSGQTYTVTFDSSTQQFTIRNDNSNVLNLDLLWARSSAASLMGYSQVNNLGVAPGGSDTSDVGRYRERSFDIVTGFNTIVFDDGGTGGAVTATIAAGKYTGEELAAEIEKQLESVPGASGQDYMVSFDSSTGAFTIVNAKGNLNAVDFDWTTSTAAAALGFSAVATPPLAAGALVRSDTPPVGSVVTYDTIEFYGMSVKLSDVGSLPVTGDGFSISTITDAAKTISMDSVTMADPEKIAAAQDSLDIDGTNNRIAFDDDGTLGSYASEIIIPSGRYTPDELAAEIEKQLEQNGSGQSYAVTFDTTTHKFTIANNADPLTNTNDLFVLWENDATTANSILGFNEKIFDVTSGVNNTIVFSENGGSDITAYLTAGPYTGDELAAEIQKQLRASGTEDYVVTYDSATRHFTITNPEDAAGNLVIQWTASPNIADTLGFNHAVAGDDSTIAPTGSDTSDFSFGAIAVGATATSDFETDGANPGDNRNALALGALKDISVLGKETLTIGSFYSIFVGQVGTDVDGVSDAVDHENFMIDQYEQRRQSIAGVSVDEEMVNLIKYQQAYAASAKLVTTLDTMLDQLLSIRS